MSEHGYDAFAIVDSPLLPAEDQQEKEYFLDIDIKEILSIVEESLMVYYGRGAANLGLGSPDVWVAFVTEHDAVEIVSGTTLRKLINKFLESDPIAGSPLIISLIDGFDSMYSLPKHSILWFDYPEPADDEWDTSGGGENLPGVTVPGDMVS
ncbi:hypothetical protein Q9L58_007015 [Maublancomyces gigas]|uniref:Uncharacterized protein n=1 Tax=Discina gigas TaxID=1032678 RepID=A0ABR3GDP4_9PEZI